MRMNGVEDPRTRIQKMVHWYLKATRKKSRRLIIKGIDRLLKLFI